MSFVICCATSEYGIIMADSRATDPVTGEVLSENVKKVVKFNSGLIIGFAGIEDYCRAVLEDMIASHDPTDITMGIASEFIASELNEVFAGRSGLLDGVAITFFVLGKDKDKKITFDAIIAKGDPVIVRSKRYAPKGKMPIITASGTSDVEDPIGLIRRCLNEHEDVVDALSIAVANVASIDQTVNDHTHHQSLGVLP